MERSDEQLIAELKSRFEENKKTVKELQQLTNELTNVNKKLEESESLKSHFISNITNEIINPFTSIIALSESILKVDHADFDKIRNMIELIHTEAFNLDFQLRNIFAAAKIEAGESFPEIVHVDIKSLINNVVEQFSIEAQKKQIELNKKIESYDNKNIFSTDPEKFKLIITNLLSNAIKYSHEKGKVEIDITLTEEKLVASVKDYGKGISASNQEIIYDRFKRIDNGINSINRGHGLGLSINKSYIDMLNGKIEVISQSNKGATFIISLPSIETNSNGLATDDNELIFTDNDSEIF